MNLTKKVNMNSIESLILDSIYNPQSKGKYKISNSKSNLARNINKTHFSLIYFRGMLIKSTKFTVFAIEN